jgi:uncharacterized protein YqfB (UPF0267 family)
VVSEIPVLPDGGEQEQTEQEEWCEQQTTWMDSYVAHPVQKLEHESGAVLWLWAGVKEGGASYRVAADDEYAVELQNGDGQLLVGNAFADEDTARSWMQALRSDYTPARLTFHRQFVDPIRDRSKTATVRYDDEKELSAGDILQSVDPDGTLIEPIRVTATEETTVRDAPATIIELGAKHGADDWRELRTGLNEHYDEQIVATSPVTVIRFEVI